MQGYKNHIKWLHKWFIYPSYYTLHHHCGYVSTNQLNDDIEMRSTYSRLDNLGFFSEPSSDVNRMRYRALINLKRSLKFWAYKIDHLAFERGSVLAQTVDNRRMILTAAGCCGATPRNEKTLFKSDFCRFRSRSFQKGPTHATNHG